MTAVKTWVLPLISMLALAACGRPDPVADASENTSNLPAPRVNRTTDPTGGAPPANAAAAPTPADGTRPSSAATIPVALRGRWGLVPADCTSDRGDAKGLLVIMANGMTFYESRAVPVGNVSRSADSFSADFAFTGEGMEWTKFETLRLDGPKLVRTISTPMASFTYARCS